MKKFIYLKALLVITSITAFSVAGFSAYAVQVSFHSPIVDAADEGDEQAVRVLLQQGQAVDARGDFDVTPLMRAAYKGHLRIAETLLRLGADTNARDIAGTTALHLASRQGNLPTVTSLLEHGADPNARDVEGWTPLMRAALARQPEIVKLLLEHGANPSFENAFGEPVLLHAVQANDLESVEALVDRGAITKNNVFLQPAITTATRKGNERIATLLRGIWQGGEMDKPSQPNQRINLENGKGKVIPLGDENIIYRHEQLADGENIGVPVPEVKVGMPVQAAPATPAFLESENPESIIKVSSLEDLKAMPLTPAPSRVAPALIEKPVAPVIPAQPIAQAPQKNLLNRGAHRSGILDTDAILAAGRQGTAEEQEVAAILLAAQQKNEPAQPKQATALQPPLPPQKKARVEVAEAIPVKKKEPTAIPLIARENTPRPMPVAVQAPAPLLHRTSAVVPKGYWVQVGNFPTQKVAIDFVNVIRRHVIVRGKRLRIIKLTAEALRREPSIAIQVGQFASVTDAEGLCRSDLSYLQCKVVGNEKVRP